MDEFIKVLVSALIPILAYLLKKLVDAAINYFETQAQHVIQKVGADKAAETFNIAREVWLIVEEHFRIKKITENVTTDYTEKIQMFNKMLLDKLPGLSQADIDYLRQAISGEINRFKVDVSKYLEPPNEVTVTTTDQEPNN